MKPLRKHDPREVGAYTLIGLLGDGGMGKVYLAAIGSRSFAVKVLAPHYISNPEAMTRLAREVEILKKINHPNIVKFVDVDLYAENPWVAMEFVNGPNLKEYVEDRGVLSEDDWINTTKALVDALNVIHKAGIVHRDIKPANILITAQGPKLIDFGIAFEADATSLTMTGVAAGSPGWMSPEQFDTGVVTPKSDVFSLGSTLYFAATGVTPWGDDATSVSVSMRRILFEEPRLDKVNQTMNSLLIKMLTKNVNNRPTAQELSQELGKYDFAFTQLGVQTSIPPQAKREKKKTLSTTIVPEITEKKHSEKKPKPERTILTKTIRVRSKTEKIEAASTPLENNSDKTVPLPGKQSKAEIQNSGDDKTEFIKQANIQVSKTDNRKWRPVPTALAAFVLLLGGVLYVALSQPQIPLIWSSSLSAGSGILKSDVTVSPSASVVKITGSNQVTPRPISSSVPQPAVSKSPEKTRATAAPEKSISQPSTTKTAAPQIITPMTFSIRQSGVCHATSALIVFEMKDSDGSVTEVPEEITKLPAYCTSGTWVTPQITIKLKPGTKVRWKISSTGRDWVYYGWWYELGISEPNVTIHGGKLFENGSLARTDGSGYGLGFN